MYTLIIVLLLIILLLLFLPKLTINNISSKKITKQIHKSAPSKLSDAVRHYQKNLQKKKTW